MKNLFAAFLLLPALVFAAPMVPKTIDFQGSVAPAIETYQATEYTIQWTVRNNTPMDLTGYRGFMYWATTNSASSIVTADCAIVTATAGVFNATFRPADLNTNGAMIYGVGVISGNVTVARQGTFRINRDPYASGAGPVQFTTIINWPLYTYTGTATSGPVRPGVGMSAATNADGSITLTATGAVATVAYGVTDTTAYRGDWGAAVSNALASAGAIKSVIATSNGLATVSTVGGTATVTVAASGILAVGASNYYPLANGDAASNKAASAYELVDQTKTAHIRTDGTNITLYGEDGSTPKIIVGIDTVVTSGTFTAATPVFLLDAVYGPNGNTPFLNATNIVGSINADLLDGQHANQFATSGVLNALSSKNPVMSLSYNATNGLIYAGIIANEGGDLEYFWNGTRVSYGASQTVQLVAGTTNVPTQNYICALPDGTLTNYTAYPGFLARALMFEVFLADTGSIASGEGYAIRSWTENADGPYTRGRISHIGERVRKEPAIWESGVLASVVTGGTVSAYVSTTDGVGWQMHRHTIPVHTNRSMWIINSAVGFRQITNLTQIAQTPAGAALFGANGDAYNIEVLGFVESGITPKSTRIMLSLATAAYTTGSTAQKLADATADVSKYDNPSVPGYMSGMSIRLARITMVRISAGNYYWIISDRRGQPLGTSGGGAAGTAAALVLYNTNDAAGVVANIGGGVWSIGTNDAVGAGGGGSQTPWTNTVSAGQFALTNLAYTVYAATSGSWIVWASPTNPVIQAWGQPCTNLTIRLGGVDYSFGL